MRDFTPSAAIGLQGPVCFGPCHVCLISTVLRHVRSAAGTLASQLSPTRSYLSGSALAAPQPERSSPGHPRGDAFISLKFCLKRILSNRTVPIILFKTTCQFPLFSSQIPLILPYFVMAFTSF